MWRANGFCERKRELAELDRQSRDERRSTYIVFIIHNGKSTSYTQSGSYIKTIVRHEVLIIAIRTGGGSPAD